MAGNQWCLTSLFFPDKEIGYTHMKIVDGVNSLLQMAGLLARLCQKTADSAPS